MVESKNVRNKFYIIYEKICFLFFIEQNLLTFLVPFGYFTKQTFTAIMMSCLKRTNSNGPVEFVRAVFDCTPIVENGTGFSILPCKFGLNIFRFLKSKKN